MHVEQCGGDSRLSCDCLAGDDGSDGTVLMEEVSEDDADDLRDDRVEDPLDDSGSGTGADCALCTGEGDRGDGCLGGEE